MVTAGNVPRQRSIMGTQLFFAPLRAESVIVETMQNRVLAPIYPILHGPVHAYGSATSPDLGRQAAA